MVLDPSPPRSRRAILAAALGAVGATVARAVTSPLPVRAAGDDGQPITIGGTWGDVQSQTTLGNKTDADRVLWVASNDDLGHGEGVAITGFSAKNTGVEGHSGGILTAGVAGVTGTAPFGIGVLGITSGGASFPVSAAGVAGSAGPGFGVFGGSLSGYGVYGSCDSGPGVHGVSGGSHGSSGLSSAETVSAVAGHSMGNSTGVQGYSGIVGSALPAAKAKTGVYGYAAQDTGSRGVWGQTTVGHGVRGEATSGLGVRGYATTGAAGSFETGTGWALQTSGRISFGKISGIASIPAAGSTKTVTPGVDLSSSTFVLLTPRASLGTRALWYTVDTAANTFTIRVSSAVAATTAIGWLVVG